ncbi:hypothetical protein [Amycolatopsis sp. NBC_01286]|uniref:hypothetical protein n=1 Tax=Amycolatopsis sp. NBC_01286 TaxID=2903560 RepID=UPI002E10FD52|nr:hypothetical protein OG570_48060 [Amycolatopsis sp. NBC_01286]
MDTPYTRWDGDNLHGRSKILTPVWVRLDAIFVRIKGAPEHAVDGGLDFTGEVPGLLHGWWPTHRGHWLGVVDYEIPFADGRPRTIRAVDQLVPLYVLRPRGEPDETGGAPSDTDIPKSG